jgi:hypothetical protein
MINSKNIYGTIGYTYLEGINKVIVFADMHDTLPNCLDKNPINVSDWFKTKFQSSKILLEEVNRDGFKLKELWTHSPHTQSLKNLFIENQHIINPIDVRPYLVPYSWELVDETKNVILKDYLVKINNFFKLDHTFFQSNLSLYLLSNLINTTLGTHFLILKKKFTILLNNNKQYINKTIIDIKNNNIQLLNNINELLDDIMEWYICAQIIFNSNKSVILHTGLAHSDIVIKLLVLLYNYKIINSNGINQLSQFSNTMSGCIQLPNDIDIQFGGFLN